jgi:hypothetical protein
MPVSVLIANAKAVHAIKRARMIRAELRDGVVRAGRSAQVTRRDEPAG